MGMGEGGVREGDVISRERLKGRYCSCGFGSGLRWWRGGEPMNGPIVIETVMKG